MEWFTRPWGNTKSIIARVVFVWLVLFFSKLPIFLFRPERGTFWVEVPVHSSSCSSRAVAGIWGVLLAGQSSRPRWAALHPLLCRSTMSHLDRARGQSCWQSWEGNGSQDPCPLSLLAAPVTGTVRAWEAAGVSKLLSAFLIHSFSVSKQLLLSQFQ